MNFCLKQPRMDIKTILAQIWAKIKQKFINFSDYLKSAFFIKNLGTPQLYKAFTLAEVLITIGVIGVVASLTIPTLINNYQKPQMVTQLKKVYTTLSQAKKIAEIDNGSSENWEFEIPSNGGNEKFVNKYLAPYIRIIKDCGTTTTGECAFSTNEGALSDKFYRFYLEDGTLIALIVWVGADYGYATLRIDINGKQKPNTYGKDIFKFIFWGYDNSRSTASLIKGKLLPEYFDRPEEINVSCAVGGNRYACAAKIMFDGWQIKDDYPW